jgi:ATP-dependent Clp protease ATP-binding subunit ClpA
MSRSSIGFVGQDHSTDGMEAIKKQFSPEFRNRLDGIVNFAALAPESISRVVDKFLFELEEQLAAKNVHLEVADSVREWLAESGYDPKMGARPMARVIQERLKRPLAEELLFGRLAQGGNVRIERKDDELAFEVDERKPR